MASILYLHGRGDQPNLSPGHLVLSYPWPQPVEAPTLDQNWFCKPFQEQVEDVNRWMESCELAIGHSFGAVASLCRGGALATPFNGPEDVVTFLCVGPSFSNPISSGLLCSKGAPYSQVAGTGWPRSAVVLRNRSFDVYPRRARHAVPTGDGL